MHETSDLGECVCVCVCLLVWIKGIKGVEGKVWTFGGVRWGQGDFDCGSCDNDEYLWAEEEEENRES